MNSKLKKLLCGVVASLFMCIGFKAYCIEFSQILDNMDELVSNVFDEQDRLLTEDHTEIAKAYWATEIISIMTEQNLIVHWMDHVQADPHLILQIFNQSFDNTLKDHPLLASTLLDSSVIHSMENMLGIADL